MNDFFANIYELFYYGGQFSDDLFSESLYATVGLLLVISSIVMMVTYYYVINHPRFYKLWHWVIWVLLTCFINFGLGYYFTTAGLNDMYFEVSGELAPYHTEFYIFSVINAVYSLLFAIIFSVCIKWGSSNCRRTPF